MVYATDASKQRANGAPHVATAPPDQTNAMVAWMEATSSKAARRKPVRSMSTPTSGARKKVAFVRHGTAHRRYARLGLSCPEPTTPAAHCCVNAPQPKLKQKPQ